MEHYITLANGKKIGISNYCKGIKLAKLNPEETFKYGLTTWYPTSGEQIIKQFRDSIHDRINNKLN